MPRGRLLAGGPLLARAARAARRPRPGLDRARCRVPRHDGPAHWFPSIRDRFQIRTNVLAVLRGETAGDLAWTTLTIVRNKNKNRGASSQARTRNIKATSRYRWRRASCPSRGRATQSTRSISGGCSIWPRRGDHRLLADPAGHPRAPGPARAEGLGRALHSVRPGFPGSLRELGRTRRPALGLWRVGLPRPGAPRPPGSVHTERRRGRPAPRRAGSEPGGAGSHCPPIGNARPVSRWRTSPNRRSPWYSGGRGDEARIEMQTLEGAEALGIAWRARAGRGSRVEAGPARRRVRGRQRGVLAFERIGGPLCEAERDPLFRHQPVETRGAASRDRTPARQAGGQPRGFQWSRLGQRFTPEAPAARGITVGGPPDRLPGSVARPRTSTRTGGGSPTTWRFWPELLDLRDGLDLSWSARRRLLRHSDALADITLVPLPVRDPRLDPGGLAGSQRLHAT